jgi:carboxymethylenebutenolidase
METKSSTVSVATADGSMTAHQAEPTAAGRYPAVIVVMEAFGLNDHIKKVAERIAAEGFVAIAPDMYYRQRDAVVGYDKLDRAIQLMSGLEDGAILADISSVLGYLEKNPAVRADRIGITGFCMGGRISFLSACNLSAKIKAAAPFYGGGIGGLLDQAKGIACPVLAFFGDQDAFIPNDEVDRVRSTLKNLGKDAEVVVYPGAQHGFFCDERDSYNAAAASDAWEKLGKFFSAHLKS